MSRSVDKNFIFSVHFGYEFGLDFDYVIKIYLHVFVKLNWQSKAFTIRKQLKKKKKLFVIAAISVRDMTKTKARAILT